MDGNRRHSHPEILLSVLLQTYDGNVMVLDEEGHIALMQYTMCLLNAKSEKTSNQDWIGHHYLEFYTHIEKLLESNHDAIKAGIASVLSGAQQDISLKHPFPDGDDNHGWQLEVRRVSTDPGNWIVIKQTEITEFRETQSDLLTNEERKVSSQALRESEERYRTLFEQAADGVVVVDPETRGIFQFNDYACINLGYTREEFQSLRLDDLEVIESPDDITCHANKIAKTGQDIFETQLRDKSGYIHDFHMQIRAIHIKGKPYLLGIWHDITELKQQQAEFVELTRLSPAGIYKTDPQGHCVYVNERWCEMAGLSPKQAQGDGWIQALHLEDRERIAREWYEHAQSNKAWNMRYRFVNDKGEAVWILGTASALRNDVGQVTGYLGVNTNITEIVKAEKELCEKEKRYRQLYNNTPAMLHSIDSKGRIISVSEYWLNHMGYERDEVIGHFSTEFLTEDSQRYAKEVALPQFFSDGYIEDVPYKFIKKNGEIIEVLLSATAEFDDSGSVERSLAVMIDVTERNSAIRKLKESERTFHVIADYTYDWESWHDEKGQILWINSAVFEISGYTVEECMAMVDYPLPLVHPEDRHVFDRIKSSASTSETGNDIPFRIKHKDSSHEPIWASVSWNPVLDDNHLFMGYRTSVRNITERKKMQMDLQYNQERFLLAQKVGQMGVWERNLDNDTVYWSENVESLFGLRSGEFKKNYTDYLDTIVPEDRERIHDEITKALEAGHGFTTQYRVVWPDGSLRWLSDEAEIFNDANGKPNRLVGTVQDISERKKFETELVHLNTTLEAAQVMAKVGYWSYDIETQMPSWSDQMFKVCGYDKEDGVPCYEDHKKRWHPDDWEMFDHAVQGCIAGEPYNIVIRIRFPDNSYHYINTQGFPIFDDKNEIKQLFGTSQDITELKQAEEKLISYQQQLKSLTSQLTLTEENLKKHIAMQLHDNLCQQLAMLRVNAGLLARDIDDIEIQTDLKKMYDTVGNLLNETKALTMDLSYPELHLQGFEKAVESWSLNEIQRKHGISVSVQYDETPKPLSEEVKIVLFRGVRELLMNVVKHARADNVAIEISHVKNNIVVKVKDDGIGFCTTEHIENEGYSFGVLSVFETLDRLGGYLEYTSKPDHGCVALMVAPLDIRSQATVSKTGESL